MSIPAEWDIRVLCTKGDFMVVATNRDGDGFNGRIMNNPWRALQPTALAVSA